MKLPTALTKKIELPSFLIKKKNKRSRKTLVDKLGRNMSHASFFSHSESYASPESSSPESSSPESTPFSGSRLELAQQRIVLGARASAMKVFKKMKTQFADRNKCYRELVQNAMDAGTDRMYFTFTVEHLLEESKQKLYLHLFKDDLEKAGKSIESMLEELPEPLRIQESGECEELQQLLGLGYAAGIVGQNYELEGEEKDRYLEVFAHHFLSRKDHHYLKKKRKTLRMDRKGISWEIIQRISGAEGQQEYKDLLLSTLLQQAEAHERKKNFFPYYPKELDEIRKLRQQSYTPPYSLLTPSLRGFTDSFFQLLVKKTTTKNLLEEILQNTPKNLRIVVEDFGRGMTHAEREQFLKRIFSSSKTNDLEQTGRFGVGVLSIWALHPEKVIYESVRAGEAWEYHFLQETEDSLPGELYIPEKPRERGTKITIHLNNRTDADIATLIHEAEAHLRRDCRHIEKAIYFNGRTINESFDLPECPVRVRFGKRGVEGVIGLASSNKQGYVLENNRIILESKDEELLKEEESEWGIKLRVLISSPYLNYDIARAHVERDANFYHIIRLCGLQLERLVVEALIYLRDNKTPLDTDSYHADSYHADSYHADSYHVGYYHPDKSKVHDPQREQCQILVERYLKKNFPQNLSPKKVRKLLPELPAALRDLRILYDVQQGKEWTFSDFLTSCAESKEALIAREPDNITKMLAEQGTPVFYPPYKVLEEVLEPWVKFVQVESKYQATSLSWEITLEEKYFLQAVQKSAHKHRRYFNIKSLVPVKDAADSYSPWKHLTSMDEGVYLAEQRKEHEKKSKTSLLGKMFPGFRRIFITPFSTDIFDRIIGINFAHPYVHELVRMENLFRDGLAGELFLQHLQGSAGRYYYDHLGSYDLTKRLLQERKKSGEDK